MLYRAGKLAELLVDALARGDVAKDALQDRLTLQVHKLRRDMDISDFSLPGAVAGLEIHRAGLVRLGDARFGFRGRLRRLQIVESEPGKLFPGISQLLMGRRVELHEARRRRINHQDSVR